MARNLTDKGVAALKPRDKQYAFPDPQLPGHYVRVTPTGNKSFVAVARDPRGKQVWTTIGSASLIGIEEARTKAREVIKRVKGGQDRDGPKNFEVTANEWLKRHVDANGLRDAKEIRRVLGKHLMPVWGGREFESIRRGDVASLLDAVEDESGARTADKVLEIMSGVSHWYEKRHEDYTSPIVRGMKRYLTKDHRRDRILSDDEIRTLWAAADKANGYGVLVRLLLLTGQRTQQGGCNALGRYFTGWNMDHPSGEAREAKCKGVSVASASVRHYQCTAAPCIKPLCDPRQGQGALIKIHLTPFQGRNQL